MEYTIGRPRINYQAEAIMAFLEGPWNCDAPENTYARIETAHWHNGRERGFSISVYGISQPALFIAFGEHRNSDNIFVDWWIGDVHINPPTASDLTDEAYYNNRRMFSYGAVVAAVDHIRDLIEEHIKTLAKEK